jgi:hypothetical protein
MNLKKYLENIVFIGFIIAIFILLIVYVSCYRNDKRRTNKDRNI